MPNAMAISLQPAKNVINVYYTIAGPWDCHDDDNPGLGGRTMRGVIQSCLVLRSSPAVRFLPAYRASPYTIAKAYIGHQAETGDNYDFDGNQVQLTWDGNPDKLINANDLWSDLVQLEITKSKALVFSVYLSGVATIPCSTTLYQFPCYFKDGDDAATTDATGYSNFAPFGYLNLIQTLKPD